MSLLFRTDASVAIGTGHVMRCLALAQAWQDRGQRAVFAMAESTPALQSRLANERCEVLAISSNAGDAGDAEQVIALAHQERAEWIVVDGYRFTSDYQRALKAAGCKVLFLDDYGHASHYSADLVMNQNAGASEALYASREPYTRLLLGPRYALLRREFTEWREWKREVSPTGRGVLVTMGGSDPENVTERVVEALTLVGLADLEAIVVVGGSTSDSGWIQRFTNYCGRKITVRRDVTNIAELMAWADVAVSSAGTTCWELCLLALPALLVNVAENQTALARELARRQCAIHLGGPRDFTAQRLASQLEDLLGSEQTRQSLASHCRELVDGKGALRVVSSMGAWLHLRRAQENDCRVLWEWANDPQVRSGAFSSVPIPWEQHEIWFASKMKDPNCSIFIAEDSQGRAVGQFRVDWRPDGDGEIDVSVAAAYRGAGYGGPLINLGVSSLPAERSGCLHAFVKLENQASRRVFEHAGFSSLGEESIHGQPSVHYVRTREGNHS